jgi:hypothetical protein
MVRSMITATLMIAADTTASFARPLPGDLVQVKLQRVVSANNTAFVFVEVANKTPHVLRSVRVECAVMDENRGSAGIISAFAENVPSNGAHQVRGAALLQQKATASSTTCRVVDAT